MYCYQIFSLLALTDIDAMEYTIKNVIVADNFEMASRIARLQYGETAIAIDTMLYKVGIGFTYKDGIFYDAAGNKVDKNPTESERIASLETRLASQNETISAQGEEIALLNETLLEVLMG